MGATKYYSPVVPLRANIYMKVVEHCLTSMLYNL